MKSQSVFLAIFTVATTLACAVPAFARPGTLYAQDVNSRINVRSAPTTTAASPHYGVVGDRVEIIRQLYSNGDLWNFIRFQRSGAEGWVRSDFVSLSDSRYTYGKLTSQNSNDRINVRSAPTLNASVQHYGLSGDVVKLLDGRQSDGAYWRYVEFPSGAKGWVRSDLVLLDEGGC